MVNESVTAAIDASMNASLSNESAQQAAPILGNLSWQAFWLIVVIVAAAVAVLLAIILRPKTAKSKGSAPFIKAFFLTALFTVAVIVTENLGWYGPGGIPDWLQVVLTVFLFVVLINLFRSENKVFQERVNETFPAIVRDHLRQNFDSELNIGDAPGSRMPLIKVLPNTDYGGSDDSVAHYLAFTNRNRYVHYAFGLKSGVMLEVDEDPSPEKVVKIFKRSVARQIPAAPVRLGPDSVARITHQNDFAATPTS